MALSACFKQKLDFETNLRTHDFFVEIHLIIQQNPKLENI